MFVRLKASYRPDGLILAALFLVALLVRLPGIHVLIGDMGTFIGWSHQLTGAGHWHGLSKEIGNYNAPFLYLLDLATLLPGQLIVKIKLVWMVFDVLLAFFTFKLVRLARPTGAIPVVAALIMLLVPSVVINASFYGQIDSMWASFALGGTYFLITRRFWWGASLCAVALSLKPQGIFVFPLLGLLILAGRVPWRSLIAVPVVYLALDIPALLAGRDPGELLTIYSLSRQDHWVSYLTWNAPSVYAFIPAPAAQAPAIKSIGQLLCIALILGVCYALIARKVEMTPARIVAAGTLFSIMAPFFLPGMHERYFFLADVMTVVVVFFRPRLWFVPLLTQAASLLAYEPYTFGLATKHPGMLPLVIPATLELAALLVMAYTVLRDAADAPAVAPAVAPEPARDAAPADPPTLRLPAQRAAEQEFRYHHQQQR